MHALFTRGQHKNTETAKPIKFAKPHVIFFRTDGVNPKSGDRYLDWGVLNRMVGIGKGMSGFITCTMFISALPMSHSLRYGVNSMVRQQYNTK